MVAPLDHELETWTTGSGSDLLSDEPGQVVAVAADDVAVSLLQAVEQKLSDGIDI